MRVGSGNVIGCGRILIRTPEGVVFSMRPAGPVSRCMAWILDQAVVYSALSVLKKVFGLIGLIDMDIAAAVNMIAYFSLALGYGIAMEWHWQGWTIGKRVFGIRVADARALRLGFSQIVIRNLLRAVDVLPAFYMAGGLSCAVSPKRQRLGDIAADTIVTTVQDVFAPDLEKMFSGKHNSFREMPHLAARLRRKTSPEEAAVALKAILRRDLMLPEARLAVFKKIADHFRSMVRFPREVVEGLSDERYVANAVEILYREKRDKKQRETGTLAGGAAQGSKFSLKTIRSL